MINIKNKTLLVIAAHLDDAVLGCGGLISKIKEAGGKVFILFLTNGATQDFSTRGRSIEQEREKEISKVAQFLNYDGYKIAFPGDAYHLKLDTLPQRNIIHEIERGEKISLEALKPDIIAFHRSGDYNQDHSAAARAAFTACRPAPKSNKFVPDIILSFEEPTDFWSLEPEAKHNFYVELTRKQINDKLHAVGLYKSQLKEKGHPRHPKAIKSLAIFRGSAIGVPFAEAFYNHRIKV